MENTRESVIVNKLADFIYAQPQGTDGMELEEQVCISNGVVVIEGSVPWGEGLQLLPFQLV